MCGDRWKDQNLVLFFDIYTFAFTTRLVSNNEEKKLRAILFQLIFGAVFLTILEKKIWPRCVVQVKWFRSAITNGIINASNKNKIFQEITWGGMRAFCPTVVE